MESFRRLHCHNYSLIWSPFCRNRKFTLLTNPGKLHCYFFRENHFFSCICQVLRVLVGSFILQVDFFFSSLSSLIIWFTLIFCLDGVSLLARIKRLPMPCNIIMYPGTSLHWLSVFLIHSFNCLSAETSAISLSQFILFLTKNWSSLLCRLLSLRNQSGSWKLY